jgi:prevent-host-death family protein
MKSLSIREARLAFSHLDELSEEHGELIVTRHGRPVFRVLPVRAVPAVPSHRELRAQIGGRVRPSEDLLREERDEA